MAEATTSPTELVFPPRFWWLKRLTMVLVAIAGMLVGLRYVALHVAKRRLNAAIAAIKARGEPLRPADFLDSSVLAEEDGGRELLAAGKLFVVPKQYQQAWDQMQHSIPGAQNGATVEAVLSANREALKKVRDARGKRVVNWMLREQWMGGFLNDPALTELTALGNALAIAAQQAIADGKHDEAVEYIRDWLMVGCSVESQPLMIAALTASAMQQQASSRASTWAPTLRIGKNRGDASEASVRALIDELLDDKEATRRGRRWAWQGERMIQMQLIDALAGDDEMKRAGLGVHSGNPIVDWWMRPVEVASAQDLLDTATICVKAAGAGDLPQASKILKQWESRAQRDKQMGAWTAVVQGNLSAQYRAVYYRREAAVALAARMCRLKYVPFPELAVLHTRDPKTVDDLVPEFLPEAPLDPLLGGGAKIAVHADKMR